MQHQETPPKNGFTQCLNKCNAQQCHVCMAPAYCKVLGYGCYHYYCQVCQCNYRCCAFRKKILTSQFYRLSLRNLSNLLDCALTIEDAMQKRKLCPNKCCSPDLCHACLSDEACWSLMVEGQLHLYCSKCKTPTMGLILD